MPAMSDKNSELDKVRHSMAHVLAEAVKRMFPKAKLGFGPTTEDGFYYDFDFSEESFKDSDLKKIQSQMKKILSAHPPPTIEKTEASFEEACQLCEERNESFKLEYVKLLHERGIKTFTFFGHGGFMDLCEGPHISSLAELPVDGFKLDRVSGAYWLGSESRPMLTRIYALCFANRQELHDHLEKKQLAQKFDHKKLGKELGLFSFDDRIGKGLPLWLPAGTALRSSIESYVQDVEFQYGYERVSTPQIARKELYETSGHLPAFKGDMFPAMSYEGEEFYLRPMNCPHHHVVFSQKKRSFRELPVRLAEYGQVFRFEKSGELSGLLRTRSFTINDAHIYCREDQISGELGDVIKMQLEFFRSFGLTPYKFRLSMGHNPDLDPLLDDVKSNAMKFFGDRKMWEQAEGHLVTILEKTGITYDIAYGEAAFYGPKIDTQFRNLAGREETLSTVQIDFLSAEKFDLSYQDSSGKTVRPIIIHRAPLSSTERLISLLIEHYRGAFPLWCAPVQIGMVPVHEDLHDYCQQIAAELKSKRIRVKFFDGQHSFAKKVGQSIRLKIPLTLIIGQKERCSSSVTYRRYGSDANTTITLANFHKLIDQEIADKASPTKA